MNEGLPMPPRAGRRGCRGPTVALALLTASVVWLLHVHGFSAAGSILIALGLLAGLSVLAIVLVVGFCLLCSPTTRRNLVFLLRQLPLESERKDFAAARRVVDHPGRSMAFGRVTAWTDTGEDFRPILEEAVQHAGDRFSDLTGLPAEMAVPLRVLCFERSEDLAAYARIGGHEAEHLRGYYAGLFCKRVVLCRETSERVPNTLASTLAHELTHHLFRTAVYPVPPPWLDEGIPEAVAARCGRRLTAPGASLRALKAARTRGHLLEGRSLFALSRVELSRSVAHWHDATDCAFVTAFYRQSGSVVRFLHKLNAGAFRRFVQGLPHRGRMDWFAACFGLSADDAVFQWQAEVNEEVPPPFEAPPAGLAERMQRELARYVSHAYEPIGARLLALHLLGSTGYPWHARVLVDALTDHEPVMHEHARMALEDLAGECLGDGPEAWRAWLAELPESVVAPES